MRFVRTLLIVAGFSAGVSSLALAIPAGPPAGSPILNSTIYQRNSSVNIDTATIRSVNLSTFTNVPSLPNGITISGALYNSAGTTTNGNPLFPTPYSYGAVEDGVTDDSNALQSAITAAETFPAKTLYLPPGTFRVTRTMRVKKDIRIVGLGANVESDDSDYFQKAGAPSATYGPATIIYFDTANVVGLLIQQDPTATYKAQAELENIFFAGPDSSSGTAGHGIVVDSGDVDKSFRVYFKNISVANFGGYGIYLKQGYYGSKFDFISTWYCGLTGFYTAGTSQGEWSLSHLRSFGCGIHATTEADGAGLYVGSGSGISLYRISCSAAWVHAMFSGTAASMIDYQAESFSTNVSTHSSLVISGSHVDVHGAYFSPNGGFLGKIIDMRTSSYCTLDGLAFYSTVDSTGWHIYETTTTCSSNQYNYFSSATGVQTNVNTDTCIVGRGTELRQYQAITGNRKRNALTLQIFNIGGTMQHRWYDISESVGGENAPYATGLPALSVTLSTTPTGTDASTAFANGGKISSANHSLFILDTAEVNGAQVGYTPMLATVSYSTGVATSTHTFLSLDGSTVTIPNIYALQVKASAVNQNVFGVTRDRMVLSFTDATSGLAYDLTTLRSNGLIEVTIEAWLPIYGP